MLVSTLPKPHRPEPESRDQFISAPGGFFLLGNVSFGDQDSTVEIDGFSFSSYTITAAADYRVLDNLIVGVAFGFSHLSTDFDVTLNSSPNQYLNNDSCYLSAYSTYYLPKEFYVDGIISFAHNDFNSRRVIDIPSPTGSRQPITNRAASADYGGTQFGFSLGGGRDWSFDTLTINTSARLGYSRTDIDSYTENPAAGWELAFDSQIIESLTTRLAVQASYAISTNFGVLLPYVKASWAHEFMNDGDGIGFRYANDPTNLSEFTIIPVGPDRNYFPLGAGVSTTFPNGWAAFLDYESTVGIKDFTSHLVTVGLRKEF